MCFLSSNISVFPRKTTFSNSRPDINLARLNWAWGTKAECAPTLSLSVGEKNGHFDHVPYLRIPNFFRFYLHKDRSFNLRKV